MVEGATHITTRPVGFIGLGVMGQPMALNLVRAGVQLVVWNRNPDRSGLLHAHGATVVPTIDDVFERTTTVFVMLVNADVTDGVLGRGTSRFDRRVADRTVISTGSVSPDYSRSLARSIAAAGGAFVESPVSGSRGPAERGTLVALLGGAQSDIERVRPLLEPMTREAIYCGPIGAGLLTKLAVNHYLNVMLAALAEAIHFADGNGLDRALVQRAIMVGPMASELTGIKLAQLVSNDYEVRAAASDALASTRLIGQAARAAGVDTPLLDLTSALYEETVDLGFGGSDMIAVINAIQARSHAASVAGGRD